MNRRFTYKLGKRKIVVHEAGEANAKLARDRIIRDYFADTDPAKWVLSKVEDV